MATELALTHDTIKFEDRTDSFEEFETLDDAELSVARTPKSIVLPLVVAIVTGAVAYLQAPQTIEVHRQPRESADAAAAAKQVFQEVRLDDHWATAEVAPMTLGLDG